MRPGNGGARGVQADTARGARDEHDFAVEIHIRHSVSLRPATKSSGRVVGVQHQIDVCLPGITDPPESHKFRRYVANMTIDYKWRGDFDNADVNALHAEGFNHKVLDDDWKRQLEEHSLGWVCARDGVRLVGFVNVAWDGAVHAFVIDTLVTADAQRQGIGTQLIAVAEAESRAVGCEWLHVDFEDNLRSFYFDACGFTPTSAGLIAL